MDMQELKKFKSKIIHGNEELGIRRFTVQKGKLIEGVQRPIPQFTDAWIKHEARLPSGQMITPKGIRK